MQEQSGKRIVILGGGFGGIYAARRLEKALARDSDVEITLVNRENFFLFTPMLHEVAASDVDITAIVSPIRELLKRAKFLCGEVNAIDLARKRVVVLRGEEHHRHELEFDHLILALGSTTNFSKLPGVEENSITMKTLGDAIYLRNRIIGQLEDADAEPDAQARRCLMTFVVSGGGFAGIETVGSINDLVRDALKFYPRIEPAEVRVVVVHSGKTILPELGNELGSYAQKKLADRKVEIHTESKIVAADRAGVTLEDGTVIPTRTLIWTAGTSAHELLRSLPCKLEHGRVTVNEFLEVPGWAGVWAMGDCAHVPNPASSRGQPATAQHALREARTLADNLIAELRGGKKAAFNYKTMGLLASIGHRTGVAKIFGVKFSGFFAWWLWRTVYLSKLPRLEKKIRVAMDWTLDLLFPKDLVQFLTTRAPTMSRVDSEPPLEVETPIR